MCGFVFAEECIGILDTAFHLLNGKDSRARGHVVPAVVLVLGNVVDPQEAGAQTHTDIALFDILNECDPDETAADL